MNKTLRLLGIIAPWIFLVGGDPARPLPYFTPSQAVGEQAVGKQAVGKQESLQLETPLSIRGILTEGDAKLEDGSRYDSHIVSGKEGQTITITMESSDFDPVLILNTLSGELIDSNDDSNEGSTAKITVRLPFTGEYQVLANAYSDFGRGRYKLSFTAASKEEIYQADQFLDMSQWVEEGWRLYQGSQFEDARELYESALEIALDLGDRANEATILNNLGLVFHGQGNYQQALGHYQNSLSIANEIESPEVAFLALLNIGNVNLSQGNLPKAIDYYEQSREVARATENIQGETLVVSNISAAHLSQGDYAQALASLEQNLETVRALDDRTVEAQVLLNIGNVYAVQGSYTEARNYLNQGLELGRETESPVIEALALNNIGSTYLPQENYAQAIDYLEQSLAISQSVGDRANEAITLVSIGATYLLQEQYSQALDFLLPGLEISQETGNRSIETIALNGLGMVYRSQGRYEKALIHYQQSLSNARALGDPAIEAEVLSGLGELFESKDQTPLSIVFFKQAISTYEQIRSENQGLSQELRDSYTTAVEGRYRRLADLLLQQDRVLEAQQVLDLLKIQEIDDYLRGVGGTESAFSILSPERSILDRHNEIVASAVNLSQELSDLQETEELERSDQQNQRIDTILELQEEITQEFLSFSRSREIQEFVAALVPAIRNAAIQLESFNLIQKDLPSLNAALIYPLILDDRLEVVALLPDTPPLRRTVEGLTKAELNQTILDLRQALDSPRQNPLPAAQQLYSWLIEPIETDLAQSGVDSLLYAPDGQLRYVPLAALHDGDRWLIERFGINNITAQSLSEYDDTPTAQPRVLAGAFANTTTSHTVEVGGELLNYAGLPFAGVELENLKNSQPDIKTFLDEDFSLRAVKRIMNEYEVLHFATHAAFVNSKPEDSFILFGNGDTPNVLDIGSWNLSNVDLVVLSACETGLDGFGNGAEILGMGYQFQLSGAGAVMASLWGVSDRGTQDLMTRFYDHLGQGKAKAKALQQAQIDLINSSDAEIEDALRGGLAPANSAATLPDELKGLRHPYYWAPFILIGNGL
ncbi:MAG: CHAT domain-containing protein [Cyanobacteria bacterium J06649_5]